MDRCTSKPIRLKSMGGRSVAEMLDALERKSAPTSDGRRRRGMWTQEFLASGKPGKASG
jgi:hypothetical protein